MHIMLILVVGLKKICGKSMRISERKNFKNRLNLTSIKKEWEPNKWS